MSWLDMDMEQELERRMEDFERRLEEGRGVIRAQIERAERRCKEAEEVRRRDWEETKGHLATEAEKRQFESDSVQRLLAALTDVYVNVVRSAAEDMRREFAETRAESRAKFEELLAEARAQRQATLGVLDRLPPKGA
jgi:myo-inositol-1-phosphate synthase